MLTKTAKTLILSALTAIAGGGVTAGEALAANPSAHAAAASTGSVAAPTSGTSAAANGTGATTSGASAPADGTSAAPAPSAPATPSPVATPEVPVLVGSGPITLRTRPSALLGSRLDFAGSAPPRDRNKTIAIEHYEPASATWVIAATASINPHGTFLVRWRTNLTGRVSVRAAIVPSGSSIGKPVAAASSASPPSPRSSSPQPGPSARAAASDSSGAAQITIYQPAISTWFGPGFFSQETACGQVLQTWVIGVANRTLPCGTLVEVSYGSRRLTVPVIDRGPYANGADWDLTEAAAEALGITETVKIGTLVVGTSPNTPTLGTPPGAPTPQASATTGGAAAG
jgi:peptidoglycan lytic transglycosylase